MANSEIGSMPAICRDTGKKPVLNGGSSATISETRQSSTSYCWYSRRLAFVVVLMLFGIVRIYSEMTPPFQAQDEFNHVKRAYLLSNGVFLATVSDGVVGGYIDTGLLTYMKCFGNIPFNYANKMDRSTLRECNAIRFAGQTTFSSFPNTAIYFPLLYSPQALALLIGRLGGLTVSASYYLARLFSQFASLALIFLSMFLFPLPPAVLALLFMPISLFQLASASLDPMSFASAAVISALFMRVYDRPHRFDSALGLCLFVCILLLSLAKIIYVLLASLLLRLYYRRRSITYIVYFAVILCIWSYWIFYARNTLHQANPLESHGEHITVVSAYISKAWNFCDALFSTLTNFDIVKGYFQSFIGVLGASDTPLGSLAYSIFSIGILAIIVFSMDSGSTTIMAGGRSILALTALATLLFLFFVAFSEWSVPGEPIDSVQGRYFYPTAVVFLYALWGGYLSKFRATACISVLVILAFCSIELSIPALLDRYWASESAEAIWSSISDTGRRIELSRPNPPMR